MLNFLKILDNPMQDIPLAAVLKSPIVGLNEEDLARVRLADKNNHFYGALLKFRQQDMSEARSEEHTSELQSRGHLVCRLLLENKKKKNREEDQENLAKVYERYPLVRKTLQRPGGTHPGHQQQQCVIAKAPLPRRPLRTTHKPS